MKSGDLLLIRKLAPMYPASWKTGDKPMLFDSPQVGIYMGEEQEGGFGENRVFYSIISPAGVPVKINSVFCSRP